MVYQKKYKVYWHLNKKICYEIQLLKIPPKKSIKINWQSQHVQKIYYSMFNCNQNYYRYNKYYVLIMASKTWYPNK